MTDYLKQIDAPLYPDIFWSKPINARAAGSLVVLGGHSKQFNRTQAAYVLANSSGIGSIKVILPDALRPITGTIPDGEFLSSTPSGSFASNAAIPAQSMANDNDGVLLVGELSDNAETTAFLESFVGGVTSTIFVSGEIIQQLIPVKNALNDIDVMVASPLVLSQWAKSLGIPIFVKVSNLHKELELLRALGEVTDKLIVSSSSEHILVSYGAQISFTPASGTDTDRILTAVAVFCLQHKDRFKAASSAVWETTHGAVRQG